MGGRGELVGRRVTLRLRPPLERLQLHRELADELGAALVAARL